MYLLKEGGGLYGVQRALLRWVDKVMRSRGAGDRAKHKKKQ
jgi:hypothetical protein